MCGILLPYSVVECLIMLHFYYFDVEKVQWAELYETKNVN